MKTLTVDRNGTLSVQEIPKPAYGECQALVKLLSCGVCNGTDMKLIHGNFKNFDSYPAILGHEGVGRVIEVGSKVTGLHVGDIVLLPFLEQETCGFTPGWGAYSEYAVVGDAESYIANGMGEGTSKWSEGYLAQTVIKPTDKVDAVGINSLINQAMGLIRYNGKICCYGISPKLGMEIDWSKAPYNWTLQFVQWPSKKEEGEAHSQIMAWINQGVLDPMDFISDVFDFEHILDAFALVEARKPSTKKIVIQYGE